MLVFGTVDTPSDKEKRLTEPNRGQETRISEDILLSEWIKIKLAPRIGEYGGQCVVFVQRFVGCDEACYQQGFRGSAIAIEPNSDTPTVGSVVLLDESKHGHVALVVDIDGDHLVVAESNYEYHETVSFGRRIHKNSPAIRGYYRFNPLTVSLPVSLPDGE